MADVLVTSYENPDLDGTACAMAYAEFLQKQGVSAVAGVFGSLHRETEFVLKTGLLDFPIQARDILMSTTKVILVDASDPVGIAQSIDPLQVIEVIDHRKVHQADIFSHAKIQIELVGSAATLIAEKYYKHGLPISSQSALLLYGAIISNTINFQATVTTDRDRIMAAWLRTHCAIPEDFVHNMFIAKSQFTEPLKSVFEHDLALISLRGVNIAIVQLEIVGVTDFLKENIAEIKRVLSEIQIEKSVSIIFLTVVDVEKVTNAFVVIDDETERLLTTVLDITFHNGVAYKKGILMRKQITPLLSEALQ